MTTATCKATTARSVARVEGVAWIALCRRCGWQGERRPSPLLASVDARAHNREAEALAHRQERE